MKPGVHGFILDHYTISTNGIPQTAGFYLDQASVGITEYKDFPFSYSVYPNPATDFIHLDYEVKTKSQVQVCLFNTLGEQVNQVINESQFAGFYSQKISLTGLPKGIYFFRITIDGNTTNKKITVN